MVKKSANAIKLVNYLAYTLIETTRTKHRTGYTAIHLTKTRSYITSDQAEGNSDRRQTSVTPAHRFFGSNANRNK